QNYRRNVKITPGTARQTPLRGQVGRPFYCDELHDFRLFVLGPFIKRIGREGKALIRSGEAADMGCDNQEVKVSDQQTFGKTYDIIAHSVTTTDKLIADLLFELKKVYIWEI
ncbi:hypothetical protein AVEN_218349-1, partial [Araneus ventricosus]